MNEHIERAKLAAAFARADSGCGAPAFGVLGGRILTVGTVVHLVGDDGSERPGTVCTLAVDPVFSSHRRIIATIRTLPGSILREVPFVPDFERPHFTPRSFHLLPDVPLADVPFADVPLSSHGYAWSRCTWVVNGEECTRFDGHEGQHRFLGGAYCTARGEIRAFGCSLRGGHEGVHRFTRMSRPPDDPVNDGWRNV